ncbi:aquaporin-like protein [Hypomontagnella monticulosa]|nr:aquaporin-like protein [Hypomontagnella monticulosa]
MAQEQIDTAVDRPQNGYLTVVDPIGSTDTVLDPRPNTHSDGSRLSKIVSMANSSRSKESGSKSTRKNLRKGRYVTLPGPAVWVDDGYYEFNPSYGRPRTKPIWAVGMPFPRVVPRAKQRTPAPTESIPKSPEELAERGELGQGVHTNETYDINMSSGLGQREQDEVEQEDGDTGEYRNWWARIRAKHPEPLAEFLATGMAVFMTLAANLAVNLSANQDVKYGNYATACWASGLSWMFGIYIAGGVSGAHMNPAVSFCFSVFRRFPWHLCLIYMLMQFIASIVAGALAFGIYRDTIQHVDPNMTYTAKTFFSSPQEWVSMGTAFLDQVVGSAIMMIAVFALGDDRYDPPGAGMHALVLGLLVTTLKFTFGYNIGSALNPASDFGPRVVAWAVGCRGSEVFETGWWFYGPWLGTLLGSIIGCVLYDGLIFLETKSPVNRKMNRGLKKRARRLFRYFSRKRETNP